MATTTTCTYDYERRRRPLMPATLPSPANSQRRQPGDLLEHCLGTKNHPSKATSAVSHHLGLCTESLGSESSDDIIEDEAGIVVQATPCKRQHGDGDDDDEDGMATARAGGERAFPPPISMIGSDGRRWLYFRSHRRDGRLVLQEMRMPSRELLLACREDGRLKLQFAHQDEEQELADVVIQGQVQQSE